MDGWKHEEVSKMKETGALVFGLIIGVIGCLGLQMFKEGNTDTLTRLKQNNRPVQKKPLKKLPQTPVTVLSRTQVMETPTRAGLGVNDGLKPKKELPKIEEQKTDFVQEEQILDENNNPVAQNPVVQPSISFTRSGMGGRF
jgi:hypothetical protein